MDEFRIDEAGVFEVPRVRRRKRSRLGPIWKLLFYLTSVLPAAWVAWHYDFVRRLDEQLKGEAPRVAQSTIRPLDEVRPAPPKQNDPPRTASPKPLPYSPDRLYAETPNESEPPQEIPFRHELPVRGAKRPTESPSAADKTTPPKLGEDVPKTPNPWEFKPHKQKLDVPQDDVPEIKEFPSDYILTLDLKRTRKREPISAVEGVTFRVVSVTNCEEKYHLSPADGHFDEKESAVIEVLGPREIVLEVSIDRHLAKPAIVLEPWVKKDGGGRIPFTIGRMDQFQRGFMKQGQEAASDLATLKNEKDELQTWLGSPVLKPLAARNQARARVTQLETLIPRQQQIVEEIGASATIAQKLCDLADKMHDNCTIIIAADHP